MTEAQALDEELHELIATRIGSHERSLQVRIGPSELGTPCHRRLAYKLTGTPEVETQGDGKRVPWRPTVGSALHDWMADTLRADNARLVSLGHSPRWLVEERVVVGTIAGEEIDGTADAVDLETKTVIDWKFPGPTALKQTKRDILNPDGPGPPRDYRVQVQLYGRGLVRWRGLDIRNVAIYFLPMNGELDDAVFWSEPLDLKRAGAVMRRARDIAEWIAEDGRAVIPSLATKNDHCQYCPFFDPLTTDEETSCPGDPSAFANKVDRFEDLLGPQ